MFIFTYSAAVLSVIYLVFAAFIFSKKRDSVSIFLVLFMLSAAVWIGSNAGADLARHEKPLVFWSGMALIGAVSFTSFFLCFVYNFIHKKIPSNKRLLVYITPSAIFSLFAFSEFSIVDTFFPQNSPAEITPGILYYFTGLFHLGGLVYGIESLFFSYRDETPQRKKQIVFVSVGFLLLFSGVILFSIVLPLLGELRFFNLAPQFSLFSILFSAYAVFRYQLLDISIVIQRGIIYSILSIFIFGFYVGFVFLLGATFGYGLEINAFVSGAITTAVGIITTPILERYFRKITDHIFFQDRYNYQEAIEQLSNVLNNYLSKDKLVCEMSNTLKDILRVDFVRFIPAEEYLDMAEKLQSMYKRPLRELFGNQVITRRNVTQYIATGVKHKEDVLKVQHILEEVFFRENIEVLIPIHSQNERIGVITLGAKRSGDPFSSRDLTLLRTFAQQAAVALGKATLYQQVKEYSERLEEKIAERTKDIQQLQENQKRSMLTISHGLQTPLTIIKGELHFLKAKLPDKALTVFEQSIDDITRYITNLLRLARLEATADEELKKYDLLNMSILILELCQFFESTTSDKNASFEKDIQEEVCIAAHPDDIREIVTNLLNNAVKYADEARHNHVKLLLKQNDHNITLAVSDTGIGIAEDALLHVFEGFYREKENGTKKGTGLGLAIVWQLIKKYEGDISVESVLGEKTTFTVTLPVQQIH